MSEFKKIMNMGLGGHYDENGTWTQTKFCLVYCGEGCDCQPPGGVYQLQKEELKEEDE